MRPCNRHQGRARCFVASATDLHLPVDTALRAVGVGGPRRHFAAQSLKVADAAPAQALTRHGTEFVLRDVQPAPVTQRACGSAGPSTT